MAVHANPRKKGTTGNICAFCKYFDPEVSLKRYNSEFIEYDDRAKGRCLVGGNAARVSCLSACQKFEMSYNADRYAK